MHIQKTSFNRKSFSNVYLHIFAIESLWSRLQSVDEARVDRIEHASKQASQPASQPAVFSSRHEYLVRQTDVDVDVGIFH